VSEDVVGAGKPPGICGAEEPPVEKGPGPKEPGKPAEAMAGRSGSFSARYGILSLFHTRLFQTYASGNVWKIGYNGDTETDDG
jgi:hypothetical protein